MSGQEDLRKFERSEKTLEVMEERNEVRVDESQSNSCNFVSLSRRPERVVV